MGKAITITRGRTRGYAVCDECGYGPRPWTRERARTHADLKGHVVRFVVEDITVYTPEVVGRGSADQ